MSAEVFTIFPAIDLRQGKVVRLSEGDPARQTDYSENPVETARNWLDAGAKWLHVVNLDAALGEDETLNRTALNGILKTAHECKAAVQYGGGIRSLATAQELLDMGVQRIIFGTLAATQPDQLQEALQRWGVERVAVSLDARGRDVLVRGWQDNSHLDLLDMAGNLKAGGLQWLVYTDVARDGLQSGFNQSVTLELARQSRLKVIASGGVCSLEEVTAAQQAGLAGIILGRALYEGNINLKEAITRYQNAG